MTRLFRNGLVTVLATVGVALLLLFAFSVDWSDWRDASVRDVAALAAFGLASVIGAVLLFTANVRSSAERCARFPPVWAGVGLLVFAVVGGVAAAHWGWLPVAEPLVAVVGLTGLFVAVGRLVTRWSPGTAPRRTVLRAAVWGMFAATTSALVLQLIIAAGAVLAVFGGLALVDPSLVRSFIDRISEEGTLDNFSGDIIRTLTVALGLFATYAIVAPLTEEFTKLVGAAVVLRGTQASGYAHFVVGACVGLGFSVVETLGYVTAAGSAWPWLLLVRAPVAFVHVTGTAVTSYGLYRQRTRGGWRLVPYFVVAVLVHGAWNGLSVAAMLLSTESGGAATMSPAVVVSILMIIGLLALLLTACIAWTTLAARKLGRADVSSVERRPSAVGQSPLSFPGVLFERSNVRGIGS